MRCLLERLVNGQNLRTDAVIGHWIWDGPKVGRTFALAAEPLNPAADGRLVQTSFVRAVREVGLGCWEFDTLNSTYRVTALPGDQHDLV